MAVTILEKKKYNIQCRMHTHIINALPNFSDAQSTKNTSIFILDACSSTVMLLVEIEVITAVKSLQSVVCFKLNG